MRTHLVTGGAGFIGRTVVARLLDDGHAVHVVDRAELPRSRRGMAALADRADTDRLRLTRAELAEADLGPLLADADVVVHLAGRPGVQTSWGAGFDAHLRDNVLVTQRLLEAALAAGTPRVLVASSSSVTGHAAAGPVPEDLPPAPMSPYGVSKVAVEQLCAAYARRGLSTVALRFFTVYGRHQRPDMAIARMVAAVRGGDPFPLRGDGAQERDWTHVDDIAAGVVAAADRDLPPGTTCNLGSGRPVPLAAVLELVGELTGRPVPVRRVGPAPGDPPRTWADTRRAARLLDHHATVDLRDGIADQLAAAGVHLSDRSVAA